MAVEAAKRHPAVQAIEAEVAAGTLPPIGAAADALAALLTDSDRSI